MGISSPRLRRLDAALADLAADSDAMLLSELDGYVAGLIVCPEPIPPGEWLPLVWSADAADAFFADEQEAEWYARLVVDHHDAVARNLAKGEARYAPFLEVDRRHGEVLWELWIEGFAAAMELRPDSWGQIADSGDAEAAAALACLITLAEIARDECDLERPKIDILTEQAPGLITRAVGTLHARRPRHGGTSAASPSPGIAGVGRNDPCPCGSGRKHKKCCRLN